LAQWITVRCSSDSLTITKVSAIALLSVTLGKGRQGVGPLTVALLAVSVEMGKSVTAGEWSRFHVITATPLQWLVRLALLL